MNFAAGYGGCHRIKRICNWSSAGPSKFLSRRRAAGLLMLAGGADVPPGPEGRRNRAGNSCSPGGGQEADPWWSGAPGDRGPRVGRAAAERAGVDGGVEVVGQGGLWARIRAGAVLTAFADVHPGPLGRGSGRPVSA